MVLSHSNFPLVFGVNMGTIVVPYISRDFTSFFISMLQCHLSVADASSVTKVTES